MTYSGALTEARRLAEAVRDHGVKVSIELQVGADGRWQYPAKKVSVMSHHTATRRSWGLTPALALVKRGRGGDSPVPGPLCNNYGGFDLVFRIITMGIANHSGKGGPMWVPDYTIPKDRGRYVIDGCEFEGGIEVGDFTDEYREFMARANAGRLEFYGLSVASHVEHKTWAPGRKPDRLGYSTESGRQEIIMLGGGKQPIRPITPVITYEDANRDYSNGSRTLTIGKAGSDVGWVQSHLLQNIMVDRKYGPITAVAVKRWQGSVGLVRDGIFGPISWAVAVRSGERQTVIDIQNAVPSLRADGHWGPLTDRTLDIIRSAAYRGVFPQGVVAVQRAIGTTPDNHWGPVSKRRLIQVVAAIQRAVKTYDDGVWGPVTDRIVQRIRSRNFAGR